MQPKEKSISIHALREEGDFGCTSGKGMQRISIHALREEGDGQGANYWSVGATFLSTPSARRATLCGHSGWHLAAISIHALREEGDVLCRCPQILSVPFLSTPSARRATTVDV